LIKTVKGLPFLTIKTRGDRDNYSCRTHSHRAISLGYIRLGDTVITLEGRDILLTQGDMILIAAETAHLCTPKDRGSFSFQMIYIDSEWWKSAFMREAVGFSSLALPAPKNIRQFMDLIEEGGQSFEEGPFRKVLDDLVCPYLAHGDESRREEDSLDRIHREIRERPHIAGNIEELAEKAAMGKYGFIRKYAARYGLTPHADVINMRIQRAILLFESDLKLTEIAQECGFSDQSHFIRQFRLYTGLAPRDFRQAILSNSKN
jgi:AraC-like DNA-binding protein